MLRAESTIDSNSVKPTGRNGVPECLEGFTGNKRSVPRNRDGNHDWKLASDFHEKFFSRGHRGLRGADTGNGLGQKHVDSPLDESAGLFEIGISGGVSVAAGAHRSRDVS